jgi:hypothetical protein
MLQDTLLEDQFTFLIIFLSILLKTEMFQIKIVEKINTHFWSNIFFENPVVYKIKRKYIIELDRP